jgi:glucose 1-dehydrogenase
LLENPLNKRLEGKRAVITGAAKGIGLACLQRFIVEGAKVILADVDADAGEAVAREMGADGDRCRFITCDVSKRDDIAAAIEFCVDSWGAIDILVNNAGVALKGNIQTLSEETFDRVISINLKAAFLGTQLAAQHMIEQRSGVVINMSSVNAILNIPDLLAYNISKGGLNQLTRNSAIALAPYGIRVCGIGPGTIMTDLLKQAVWTDEAARKSILSRTPIKRTGKPEEIASIAAFLASDDASYIVGETIYADGGRLGLHYTVATD